MPTMGEVQKSSNTIEPESNESMAGLPQHAEHYKTDFKVRISSYMQFAILLDPHKTGADTQEILYNLLNRNSISLQVEGRITLITDAEEGIDLTTLKPEGERRTEDCSKVVWLI